MKAISVHPLYAWAIAHGLKRVENRSRRILHRGPLAICATAGRGRRARRADAECRQILARLGIEPPADEDVPRGALVAIVNLVGCEQTGGLFADDNPWATGPYCWHLANARPLTKPLPIRGRQGIFAIPSHFARTGQ